MWKACRSWMQEEARFSPPWSIRRVYPCMRSIRASILFYSKRSRVCGRKRSCCSQISLLTPTAMVCPKCSYWLSMLNIPQHFLQSSVALPCMSLRTTFFFLLLFTALSTSAQDLPQLSVYDFNPARGNWTGSQLYRQDNTKNFASASAFLHVELLTGLSALVFSWSPATKSRPVSSDTLWIEKDGTLFGGFVFSQRRTYDNGVVELIFEQERKSDGATLRHEYNLGNGRLMIREKLRPAASPGWEVLRVWEMMPAP